MLDFLFKYGKIQYLSLIILNILLGLMLPVQTMILQNIIDSVAVSNNTKFFDSHLVYWLIIFWGQQIFNIIIQKINTLVQLLLSNKLELKWGEKIFRKCSQVEYKYFEQSKTYPIIERLVNEYKKNTIDVVRIIAIIVSSITSIIGILIYLSKIGWWIVVILLITSLPIWIFSIKAALKERDIFIGNYKDFSKANYYSSIITSREYIKESRIFSFNSYISHLWEKSLYKFQHGVFNSSLHQRVVSGFFIFLQYTVITGVILLLLTPFSGGVITIGLLVAVAQALWSFVGTIQYEIILILQNVNNFRFFYKDYNEFMDFEEQCIVLEYKKQEDRENIYSIVLKDVWFRYEENSNYIIKGVNLKINGNTSIAFVGENGSGKTTLVKIIMGLLKPTKGEVLVNGVNINNLTPEYKKKTMCAIFQDYVKYNISLRENIGISNLDNMGNEKEMADLIKTIYNMEDFVNKLPQGFDTILGKNIDNGIDISGGQWQSIAIARALFSKASFLIMDEPTSSLDPIAEAELFKQYIQIAKDKTVAFVTHRLGATKFVDTIYVVNDGIILEKGQHKELMKIGGLYAKMFETQSQWYE